MEHAGPKPGTVRASRQRHWRREQSRVETLDTIRRAFAEFLTVPSAVVVGFVALAALTTYLDRSDFAPLRPLQSALRDLLFTTPRATGDLLDAIAGGLFTVTSITISLVLIALQQAAASLGFQVIDQFFRRRINQLAFGYFVGLTLYALLILSTVADPHDPIYGASLAILLAALALYLLLLLLYTTVNQMRPAEIVAAIHDHTLVARERQLALLRTTRRSPHLEGYPSETLRATMNGFVDGLDVGRIAAAACEARGPVEVVLRFSMGTYVAFEDPVAEIRCRDADDLELLCKAVHGAVRFGRQRDLDVDPGFGIEELENIAWTAISTSKQTPQPGLLAIRALRDLLARWTAEQEEARAEHGDEAAPVVYPDDVLPTLMNTLESLAVVATESMQHQAFAEVLRALASLFDRLPPDLQLRAEDLALRVLPGMGDLIPTAELDAALSELAAALAAAGRGETAATLRRAQSGLQAMVGRLSSRSARVAPMEEGRR